MLGDFEGFGGVSIPCSVSNSKVLLGVSEPDIILKNCFQNTLFVKLAISDSGTCLTPNLEV